MSSVSSARQLPCWQLCSAGQSSSVKQQSIDPDGSWLQPPWPQRAPPPSGTAMLPTLTSSPPGHVRDRSNWLPGTTSMQNRPSLPVVAVCTVLAGKKSAAVPDMVPLIAVPAMLVFGPITEPSTQVTLEG